MQRDSVSIAIVGLGPRGINVLERITAHAIHGSNTLRLQLHLIDPGVPGAGIHYPCQPDYLLLNTVASQITMFMDPTIENAGPLLAGPSLYEWAVDKHYLDNSVGPNSYLPRRLFGEYLNWVFHYLLLRLERYCDVQLHPCKAVDLHVEPDNRFMITLEGTETLNTDFLFLTTGHAENYFDQLDQERENFVEAYHKSNNFLNYIVASPNPIDQQLERISSGTSVAVEGMGLTSVDTIAALTIGRGGKFYRNDETNELIYRPSGEEPTLAIYSRSGLPLSARAANQKGVSDQYRARFLTQAAVSKWHTEKVPGELNFSNEVLPLIVRDMAHAYYLTHARHRHGDAFANLLDEALVRLSVESADAVLELCLPDVPIFTWKSIIEPIPSQALKNEKAYQTWLYSFLEDDIKEAHRGNVDSPLKAACDVLRDIRDNLRNAIDFGSLSSNSHQEFITGFLPAMNRLAVGPPLERVEEWLALAKAGYLIMTFGPNAYVTMNPEKASFVVNSSLFPESKFFADTLIRARVPKSSPTIDRSIFTQKLLKQGVIRPFFNGDIEIGGIEVDAHLHIVSFEGKPLHNAWALGTICEGAKFYTYIVPRPCVNSTALVDAGCTVRELFAQIQSLTPFQESIHSSMAV
ncbi:FAD/NAD(P)-binding protein [Halomonas llamarensis]|uniref:FAD/NAD(P)-binding protein n=1 Tax=Halomonas llamarensis TaxID=2945104 RepID=A0ABT0SQ07_9GAMM|nr:FAD/NAD(P)-binding protein [Halomonas llamarensis]MCL7929907.1 FAD/NAD(P)-binding protein [Halomonas llamarensis]